MLTSTEGLKSSFGAERCDIHVWSGACEHGEENGTGKGYLCALCENIAVLDHEVRHEIFPHVSGDYENLH